METKFTTYKVIVTGAAAITGGKKDTLEYTYTYVSNPTPWGAINFANGFIEMAEWFNGITAYRPAVQQIDGYWWEFTHGKLKGMTIKVVDGEGNIVTGQES